LADQIAERGATIVVALGERGKEQGRQAGVGLHGCRLPKMKEEGPIGGDSGKDRGIGEKCFRGLQSRKG